MERICEYCQSPFIPKRTDAIYCSASCRQLAYVLRKASGKQTIEGIKELTLEPSIKETENKTLTDQSNELTVKENQASKYPSTNTNIIDVYLSTGEKLAVNTENEIAVNVDAKKPSIDQTEQTEKKETPEQYTDYESSFLNELNALMDKRDMVGKLFSLSYSNAKSYALWLNIRFKCLVECLLTFSERGEIELNDLKEVCNAFTAVIQSRYFEMLGLNYPYHTEIMYLRDSIKKLCVNAEPDEPIVLRLKKETRQTLIVTRYELANNAPKISFSKLNFKE